MVVHFLYIVTSRNLKPDSYRPTRAAHLITEHRAHMGMEKPIDLHQSTINANKSEIGKSQKL